LLVVEQIWTLSGKENRKNQRPAILSSWYFPKHFSKNDRKIRAANRSVVSVECNGLSTIPSPPTNFE
jgi:hypothetical protein